MQYAGAQCVLLAVCAQCTPNIHRTYSVDGPSSPWWLDRCKPFLPYFLFFLFSRSFFPFVGNKWKIRREGRDNCKNTVTTTTKSETIHFEWRTYASEYRTLCVIRSIGWNAFENLSTGNFECENKKFTRFVNDICIIIIVMGNSFIRVHFPPISSGHFRYDRMGAQ